MNMLAERAHPALVLTLLSVSLVCCSCSGAKGQSVFPVHGKVLFRGKPAAGALVVFHPLNQSRPEQGMPRAVVEDDGSFALGTFAAKDGAPTGDYAVSITWKRVSAKTPGRKGPARKVLTHFPGRYENPKTSGLVVHIEEGPNELRPFDLKD
jgi:hypothetical protein